MTGLDLSGKNVLVIGLGKTGTATTRFLAQKNATITVTDEKPAEALTETLAGLKDLKFKKAIGGLRLEALDGVDLIIPSPGVPPANPLLAEGTRRGLPILSEIELAWQFIKKPVIAITGTNGKTTTTALTGHILSKAGRKAFVGGNIGNPLIAWVNGPQHEDFVVAELSSFQLQHIRDFRPFVAMLLNVTCDHLDYHATCGEYRAAKERIFENQGEGDLAILNAAEPESHGLAKRLKSDVRFFSSSGRPATGIYLNRNHLVYHDEDGSREEYPLDMIRIPGTHNAENVMAAVLAARKCGLTPDEIVPAVGSFTGMAHRIEFAGRKNDVDYYDDSKGTNVGAVLRALETFSRPIVLLLGGRDKGGDFETLVPMIRQRVKEMILFGEARGEIEKRIGMIVKTTLTPTLREAVETAFRRASAGDVVLLSPGCASFDEFTDYKERGNVFKEVVRQL
jgi:UDP-N-acetylmuramoylalanine--D-glutamate ligase